MSSGMREVRRRTSPNPETDDVEVMVNAANAGSDQRFQGPAMTITTSISTANGVPDHRASVRRAWVAMNTLAPAQGVSLGRNARGEPRTHGAVLSSARQA